MHHKTAYWHPEFTIAGVSTCDSCAQLSSSLCVSLRGSLCVSCEACVAFSLSLVFYLTMLKLIVRVSLYRISRLPDVGISYIQLDSPEQHISCSAVWRPAPEWMQHDCKPLSICHLTFAPHSQLWIILQLLSATPPMSPRNIFHPTALFLRVSVTLLSALPLLLPRGGSECGSRLIVFVGPD